MATIQTPQKPSFLGSTWAGIKGFFKGGVAGFIIGAVAVGTIAAVVGAIFPDVGVQLLKLIDPEAAGKIATAVAEHGGITAGEGAMVAGMSGAALGAGALTSVGSTAGAIVGVVKSREAGQVQAEDVVNVAKISFAQGVHVGHQMAQAQSNHHFRDKVSADRATLATAETRIM